MASWSGSQHMTSVVPPVPNEEIDFSAFTFNGGGSGDY